MQIPNNNIEDWPTVKLGDVVHINPKLPTDIKDGNVEVSFLPMKLVKEEINEIHLTETRKYADVKKGFTPMADDDVIFAKITPCMENGKIAIVHSLKNGIAFGSTEFHVLRCNGKLINKFLFYYLVQKKFRNEAEFNMTGAVGQRRVPKRFLEEALIPLPSINEQQQIVSKIEELFSELDKSIEQLKTSQQKLKVYRQSVLNKILVDTNLRPIDSLIYKLDQGWSPKCENDASKNDEWGVIKTSAVQHGYFVEHENKRLPKELKPREQHELKAGDILITRAGPRVRVGVCCMVKNVRPKLLNCDKVYRVKVKEKLIKPEYFALLLNTPKYLDEIEKMKTGISDSGVNLTQKGFLKIEIPVPSLVKQQQLIEEGQRQMSLADKLEEAITKSFQQAEALRQSILKKAFEGKLISVL